MSLANDSGNGGLHPVCDRIFLVGLLAAAAFVLWLPVFPTGDGPVHLYYADVLWSLVRHQPVYAQDYAIRHLFAPYLVHYLALVSFEQVVSPPTAEKLLIAIILLTQGFGFRFLARRLGPQASVACLWMLPLLFSWSLGGGFLNCCFATGVLLWSFGVWTLLGANPSRARLAGLLMAYAFTLAVLVLSHPVPLLVLLLFTAADLSLQTLARPAGLPWRTLLPQSAALALTAVAFLAPVLLAQKGQAAAVIPGLGFHADVLRELLLGMRLGFFAGLNVHTVGGWLALASRVGLIAIVPGVALLLWQGRAARQGEKQELAAAELFAGRPAPRLLVTSLLFLTATVFFPRSLNHSYFFPQRLWDIVWLLVLACGAAATPTRRTQRWLAGAGLGLLACTAIPGLPALAHIARAQQQLAAAQLPAGKRGLFLEPDSAVEGRGAATTYPVYAWSGARAFAASHAILLNSPWLGLTILPLRDATPPERPASGPPSTSRALLDQGLPSIYSESPLALTHLLADPVPTNPSSGSGTGSSPDPAQDRQTILERADFLLYINPASLRSLQPVQDTRAAILLLLGPASPGWRCEVPRFYAVCVHAR
jgi:hypothetical protein